MKTIRDTRLRTALFFCIIVAICLAFTSCASTEVSENGRRVLKTQMNAQRVTLRTPAGTFFEVIGMDHSTPTRAGGSVLGTGLSGAMGIIMAGAARGVVP